MEVSDRAFGCYQEFRPHVHVCLGCGGIGPNSIPMGVHLNVRVGLSSRTFESCDWTWDTVGDKRGTLMPIASPFPV